jgi:hypothetical protein
MFPVRILVLVEPVQPEEKQVLAAEAGLKST